MSEIPIDATDHGMTRLNLATGIPFAEFCAAFEQAAPAYRPAAFESCRRRDPAPGSRAPCTWRSLSA